MKKVKIIVKKFDSRKIKPLAKITKTLMMGFEPNLISTNLEHGAYSAESEMMRRRGRKDLQAAVMVFHGKGLCKKVLQEKKQGLTLQLCY